MDIYLCFTLVKIMLYNMFVFNKYQIICATVNT